MKNKKYVIMCCGGYPVIEDPNKDIGKDNRVRLADWPDELTEDDLFTSIQRASERVLTFRRDKSFRYEDFSIMKVEDPEVFLTRGTDYDESDLEEVKCCRG